VESTILGGVWRSRRSHTGVGCSSLKIPPDRKYFCWVIILGKGVQNLTFDTWPGSWWCIIHIRILQVRPGSKKQTFINGN
jgi:hypothetical protein